MAFVSANQTKNKNMFVARQVSAKTGRFASWVNLGEDFALSVFKKPLCDVSAQEAEEELPKYYNTAFLVVAVTDLTAPMEQIDPTDY